MNCETGNVCSYTNKVPSYKGLGLLSLSFIGEQISQQAIAYLIGYPKYRRFNVLIRGDSKV